MNYFAVMFFTVKKWLILSCFFLLACNKKEQPVQHVMALQHMSDLATVEYVVTKMIRANDNSTWYKFGDRKILISCKATITAGIDLSKLTPEQVHIDDKSIELTLPHSKLISINIRPEDLRTEYEELDPFREPFTSEEKNGLAIQAENQLKNSIDSLGILNTAETNASLLVNNYLRRLGYEEIRISFDQKNNPKN